MFDRRIAVVFFALLTACSQNAASTSLTPLGVGPHKGKADLAIRIRIPRKHRHAHYISPATNGITLAFSGTATFTKTLGLTPSSPGCAPSGGGTACTIHVALASGRYAVTVTTYDLAPASGAIPNNAKVLSTAVNVPLTVVTGKNNQFNVTLEGVVASLTVSGLPGGAVGTPFSAQSFTVTAKDADGNTIAGPYDNAVTLTDNDNTGATTVGSSGSDHPTSGMLLSSSDTATLGFTGAAVSATIGATASGATGSSASFTPSGAVAVTLTTDSSPGLCPAGVSGDLRYAMCNAASGNTIVFNCGNPCQVSLAGALPPIEQSETIDGGKYGNVIVFGGISHNAFFVDSGTVAFNNLQILQAAAHGGAGNDGGGGGLGAGGAIFVNSLATVSVTNDYFLDDGAVGGNGAASSGSESGGGGGLYFAGGAGTTTATSYGGGGGGGGGVFAVGADASGQNGGNGGNGDGGGGGGGMGIGSVGSAGTTFAANTAGTAGNGNGPGCLDIGGAGGFGAGGGGGGGTGSCSDSEGGAGGLGGGGGGGGHAGGAGGAGGGGGMGGTAGGSGGALATLAGGNGDTTGGGGGAAAGPAIFVNGGTLTTTNSGASGNAAFGGSGGGSAASGTADATPVFNYNGTVNGDSATQGPIASALGSAPPAARHRPSKHKRTISAPVLR
jgi:hypothetical protein